MSNLCILSFTTQNKPKGSIDLCLTFLGNYLRSLVEVNQANISLVVIELFIVLLLSVCLITCCQVIKQPRVHLHEGLKNIVDEGDDGLIPVFFAYPERNICLEKRSD